MYCFEAASTSGCIAVEPAAVMLPAWQLAAPLPPAATLPDAPPPVGAVAGAAELPAALHAAIAIDAAATSGPRPRMDVCKDALPKIAAVGHERPVRSAYAVTVAEGDQPAVCTRLTLR